ncbi:MAG: acyl-CoA dehydrogenase [Dehalococcoidia bacterium]
MDLTLSSDQETLQRRAREFLEQESPIPLVREAAEDPTGVVPGLWRQMADLGWLGFALPREYGGEGASLVDLALLYEELGRALTPGPYLASSVLAARAILGAGSDEQKRDLLPAIAAGQRIATVAQLEPSQDESPAGITATARRDGDGYLLDGIKLFVPHAAAADVVVVAARESADPEGGIALFVVERGTPGLSIRPLKTATHDWPGEVKLEGVRVPTAARLTGDGWAALEAANRVATVMRCAEMAGGMEAVVDLSVEYAKTRVQFGRPIGAFQAIQYKAVAMAIEATGAKLLVHQTAWRLEHGLVTELDVAICKAKCSRAYRLVTFEGHELHGGIGWSSEYDLQLYFRRRLADEASFGGADYHLETVARAIHSRGWPQPHGEGALVLPE